MPIPPPYRYRRGRHPFDRAALGIRIRRAENSPVGPTLNLTEARTKLMQAITAGEVKAGQGSYTNHWRWAGTTVTNRVHQLINAGWANVNGKHLNLTEAGKTALDGAR